MLEDELLGDLQMIGWRWAKPTGSRVMSVNKFLIRSSWGPVSVSTDASDVVCVDAGPLCECCDCLSDVGRVSFHKKRVDDVLSVDGAGWRLYGGGEWRGMFDDEVPRSVNCNPEVLLERVVPVCLWDSWVEAGDGLVTTKRSKTGVASESDQFVEVWRWVSDSCVESAVEECEEVSVGDCRVREIGSGSVGFRDWRIGRI